MEWIIDHLMKFPWELCGRKLQSALHFKCNNSKKSLLITQRFKSVRQLTIFHPARFLHCHFSKILHLKLQKPRFEIFPHNALQLAVPRLSLIFYENFTRVPSDSGGNSLDSPSTCLDKNVHLSAVTLILEWKFPDSIWNRLSFHIS